MRALVQRVARASVSVDGKQLSAIGPGLLVLLGVSAEDGEEQADRLADKVRALRVFDDADGRMNEPLGDREVLCISQFTLYGDTRKGNGRAMRRPRPATRRRRFTSASASASARSGASSARGWRWSS